MANNTRWTEADILKFQGKGLKVEDSVIGDKTNKAFKLPKKKLTRGNAEKAHIEFMLIAFQIPFAKEYKFLENRNYRMDYAIVEKKIAIEYEGIFSENNGKSGHTTVMGYSNNCSKYNLALVNGWKVLRYTAINYMDVYGDIEKLLST